MDLWALFFSAFISSTLLPGGSEVLLAVLNANSAHDQWLLLAVATLGNTLGGMTSWGLGRLIAYRYPGEKLKDPRTQHAILRLQRWGGPVLWLSWLPIIGDPLCVAAGWLKINPLWSAFYIAGGKAARYAFVLALSNP